MPIFNTVMQINAYFLFNCLNLVTPSKNINKERKYKSLSLPKVQKNNCLIHPAQKFVPTVEDAIRNDILKSQNLFIYCCRQNNQPTYMYESFLHTKMTKTL